MSKNYSFVSNSYRLFNTYNKSKNLYEDLFKMVTHLEDKCYDMNLRQCHGETKKGERCQNSGKQVELNGGWCWRHK